MSAAAEQKVKKLARLPGNSVCANCGTSKKFGFSTVCIKFHTFVCNNCKSSHQAISHRCKSLTMSSWTDAEVAELQAKGNDYARRTWLKNAPPVGTGGRPKEGDHVDVFKRFVVEVYERKRFYGQDDGAPSAGVSQLNVATAVPVSQLNVATAVPVSHMPPSAARRIAQKSLPPVAAPPVAAPPVAAPPVIQAPAPAPTPAADLLDFGSATISPAPASFQADFDAFGSSNPAPAAQSFQADFSSAPAPAPTPSAFGFIAGSATAPSAAPAPVNSGFSFISAPPAAPPAATPSAPMPQAAATNNFADFAGMTVTTPSPAIPTQATVKKPVMSSSSRSQKASLISSMDSMPNASSGQSSIGFNGGMPQGGMMGMSSNNAMSQQQQMMMMQQQQQMMMMMQQGGMGGMNNGGMGMMMNNGGMGINMNGGMNNGMGMGMMTTQQMMNFGGGNNRPSNKNSMNNPNAMNSLSMSGMDMSAWTTGGKK